MKKLTFIAIVSLLAVTGLFAETTFEQRSKEIKSIVTNSKLSQLLTKGELIQQVTKTNKGYIIQTQNYKLNVDIVYGPSSRIGRSEFSIFFHEPERK